MLLLKLLIVPLFLCGVSIAARRWGPQIGGLLAGFPIVTGPILFFLSVEQGPEFAARAAQGSLLAVIACVAFGLAYSHSSRKYQWPLAVILAFLSWLASAAALARFPGSLPWAAALTLLFVTAGPFLLPPCPEPERLPASMVRSELAIRMVAGAVLVLIVTVVASAVGTRWAGLMAMFPLLGSVLGVFSHRQSGPQFVARLFRGMFRGFYSFAAFCVSLALLLGSLPTAAAFAAAVALALLVQGGVYWATTPDSSSKPTTLRGAA
jgi:uncharacterized membrane protein (GlpM family)